MQAKISWLKRDAQDVEGWLKQNKYLANLDVFWRFVAGLLDVGGGEETLRFFQKIDLLGYEILERLVRHGDFLE